MPETNQMDPHIPKKIVGVVWNEHVAAIPQKHGQTRLLFIRSPFLWIPPQRPHDRLAMPSICNDR